jgi:dephospho-CoA kinase
MLTDERARRDLERIVHPAVAERREALVREARERGDTMVVIEIPLLFEVDHPSHFDRVVLVDAPVAVRRARLVRDRGLTPEEADQLIATQLPSGPKRRAADIVIDNDGDLEALEAAARDAWRRLNAS